MIGRLRATAAALRRDRRGVVAIEAAIVLALVLLPVTLGLFDLGAALTTRLRVDRALQAGLFAAWAMTGPSAAALTQAASAGAGSGANPVSARASFAWFCLSPTGTMASGTAASGTATCPDGQVLGEWVRLTASATVALPFPLPGMPSFLPISAAGTSRVQ